MTRPVFRLDRHHAVLLLALLLVAPACGEKNGGPGEGGGGGSAGSGGGAQLVPADLKGPEGVAFVKMDLPFGTIEVPDGKDWSVVQGAPIQVQGADGTVVMLQAQDGITPDQRDDYLASYHDVQMRDAPKYERVVQETGQAGGAPAARVEGKFDNGTAFVTRDYLMFRKGKVAVIAGRIPATHAARLAPLVDHMTATFEMK